MLVLTSPSLASSPLPDIDSDDVQDWLSGIEGRLWSAGLVLAIVLVLWIVGHVAIRMATRAIARGSALNDARTRRVLSKAKISVPAVDTTEIRLESERRRQRADTLRRVLSSALAVVVIMTIVIAILAIVGVPVGPMLASAGILGVALGFGAQSLVRDVLSGMFMLIEDQYGVGDVVDLGAATGAVEVVGLRSTRLRALDGTVWYVPNGEITRVGNMTRLWSRAMIEVRFAYDTDVEAARQAMLDAVAAAREGSETVAASVLSDPEVPGIESLEYNAVTLRLLCQVNPATQWDVQRAVHREMRRIFAERDIHLAVPGDAMMVSTAQPDTHDDVNDSPHHEKAAPTTDENGVPLPPPHDDERG